LEAYGIIPAAVTPVDEARQNTKIANQEPQYAVQWLMRNMKKISSRATGMGNNTIKMYLVLHICEDILDHGVPENANSAYAESAHITLAKRTSSNTQKAPCHSQDEQPRSDA
jgi:hypothetical protein